MLLKQINFVENKDRMPIGVETENEKGERGVFRDVKYRIISRQEKKKIRDEKFSQNHPMKWIARVLCLAIESINDIPVYDTYISTNDTPDILKNTASLDMYFLLLGGHVHNFGTLIEGITTKCHDCGKKQSFDINLKQITCTTSDDSFHRFDVRLESGLIAEDPVTKKPVAYKHLVCRRPTMGDALQFEKDYRPNNQGNFIEKIYGNCVFEAFDDQGEKLDDSRLRQLVVPMIEKMSSKDSAIMETAFNKNCPQIDYEVIHVCRNCSEDIPVMITEGFLYPDHL